MSGMKWGVAVAMILGMTSPALAIFDAQVLYGKRNMTIEGKSGASDSKLDGNELKAAFHLSPIPLVPVGFGASVSSVTLNDTADFEFKDFQGLEGSLEVSAWIPLPMNLTPYAKLGYVVFGAYGLDSEAVDPVTGISEDYKWGYKPSGTTIALGLKWSPLPLLGFLLEYDMRQQKLKPEEFKVDGAKQSTSSSDEIDFKTNSVLVGVELGI